MFYFQDEYQRIVSESIKKGAEVVNKRFIGDHEIAKWRDELAKVLSVCLK